VSGGWTVRLHGFIADAYVGCGFGARLLTFEPTLTLSCGFRSPFGLSGALIGFALPLEKRRSIPLCHADSFVR
jgi:hypothetical protein